MKTKRYIKAFAALEIIKERLDDIEDVNISYKNEEIDLHNYYGVAKEENETITKPHIAFYFNTKNSLTSCYLPEPDMKKHLLESYCDCNLWIYFIDEEETELEM